MSRPPRTPRDEVAEGSAVGELYVRRLMRAQLTVSLTALVAFGAVVGVSPLLLFLLPGLARTTVLGVPLPLALLVVPPFVLFVAIAVLYERRATALDEAFHDLVSRE